MPPRLPPATPLHHNASAVRCFSSGFALRQSVFKNAGAFGNLQGALQATKKTATPSANQPVKDQDKDLQKLQLKFEQGDRYEPNSLSLNKAMAARSLSGDQFTNITGGGVDVVDALGIKSVLLEYKNFVFLSDFTTAMGRIKHRDETGLRPVNQRKVAKAIRRAVGMGLLPSTHHHPILLKAQEDRIRR